MTSFTFFLWGGITNLKKQRRNPMMLQSWLIYLTLALVATATPGPAVLLITTNSTLYGWRRATFNAIGNVLGLFCLGAIAISGLGVILTTSTLFFSLVKFVGAGYLIFLGIRMILQKDKGVERTTRGMADSRISPSKLVFQAFGVAVSNPKAIVFLTALFPQFINVEAPLPLQFTILIATLMGLSFFFLMLYALLAHKAKGWLANSARVRILNRTSGALFVGFGVMLAASSNR